MKYLNEIKLTIGLVLIIFGMYFGYKMLKVDLGTASQGMVYGNQSVLTALYTPFYAGICICAGAYLIGKIR